MGECRLIALTPNNLAEFSTRVDVATQATYIDLTKDEDN